MPVILKRDNFASREPGVILVFAIIGAIALFLIVMAFIKWNNRRKAAAEHKAIHS